MTTGERKSNGNFQPQHPHGVRVDTDAIFCLFMMVTLATSNKLLVGLTQFTPTINRVAFSFITTKCASLT